MKKVLAIIIAAVLVLSCNMTAFAEIKVDGTKYDSPCTFNGDAKYVYADASGDDLTVTGKVVEADKKNAVHAMSGASVTVEKDVKESDDSHAIYANNATVEIKGNVEENDSGAAVYGYGDAQVSVKGSVTENGFGNAIYADGASVTVDGDVTEEGDGHAIDARGAGTTVTVKGSVTEEDADNAIYAQEGATVIVYGSVNEKGKGLAINTGTVGATITVGGDVTAEMCERDYAGILVGKDSTVVVEGKVTSDVGSLGSLCIGELNGKIVSGADKIHYLIGAADGSASFDSLIVTGDIPIDPSETIDGIKKRNYYYTATADSAILSGKSLTLKSSDSKKKLVVKGISTDADVTLTPNADGTVTLTLGSNFKGGLQDLMLILEDIIVKNSSGGGSTKTLFTGTTGNPVTNGRWTQNADGTWSYATTSKFANTWGCIANPNDANSAAWYYFDRSGNMLTGWQKLYWNGAYRWYYFSQTKDSNEGKCQLGGITPDGYKVGPDGAWIED